LYVAAEIKNPHLEPVVFQVAAAFRMQLCRIAGASAVVGIRQFIATAHAALAQWLFTFQRGRGAAALYMLVEKRAHGRLKDDLEIKRQRPVLDICQVVLNPFLHLIERVDLTTPRT